MSVKLNKGDKITLSKDNLVNNISVCIGWDVSKYDDENIDLDVSAFILGKSGLTKCDEDFIFYHNLKHPSGAVEHNGDNLDGSGDGDDEAIKVVLNKLPTYAERIVFSVTIYEAERKMQNFGMVDNSYIRVVDDDSNNEILRYDLKEKFGNSTAIIAGEIYKDGCEWKFHAVGEGFINGLVDLCKKFGIEVV